MNNNENTVYHQPLAKAPLALLFKLIVWIIILAIFTSCGSSDELEDQFDIPASVEIDIIEAQFGNRLSLDNPFNYANQAVPNYINEDNTNGNAIQDEVAILGRVLFYDKSLSTDNTISCASCHQQAKAFGDEAELSVGVNGITGRHSMRLVNARFSDEERFFWDERANDLETQTTMPIQDHNEMGFSGENGAPDLDDLIVKLEGIDYMVELFELAYNDPEITEDKMQMALAQFIRSIQSFDSKYDEGKAQQNDDRQDFPNFTEEENLGKALFVGRAGCNRCHQAPEFDIVQDSDNNGVIAVAGDPSSIDTEVTRAPTLRDIFDVNGNINGPLMHTGDFADMEAVIAHYNDIDIDANNNNLDARLTGGRGGNGQNLNLTNDEVNALVAFIKTLSGSHVYTDERWSDPF